MKIRRFSVLLILIGFPLLSSCSLPSRNAPSVPTREAVYTAAAETVIAQLTEVALTAASATPTQTQTAPLPATSAPQPSETPLPSGTVTPSATSTLATTATLAADDPKLRLGEPDWKDTFKNADRWSPYEDEHVRFRVRDGALIMTAFQAEDRDSWMLTVPKPDNYYLEVIATPQACSGLDRYGIIFRTDATEGYLFGFSCDGQYSLRRWNGDKFKALVDWTDSADILSGADKTNRIGLMVEGDQFSLYANGKLLTEISDDTYTEGGFGLFIASENTQDFKVQVSEVTYWKLP